ncbi:hypothetical protein [Akkermansia muciniphila]|uniref:hypothetical protein n=1 Tax=Akkermansia muciniphila TaxID=239935 RepID=UPI001BFF61FC|nr:hypothetical protein [Akkermansia muciniphila]MBT8777768.1 hypothetical protein [Akkermansia muciniphila]
MKEAPQEGMQNVPKEGVRQAKKKAVSGEQKKFTQERSVISHKGRENTRCGTHEKRLYNISFSSRLFFSR